MTRPTWSRLTVRQRLTATIALLTSVALLAVGGTLYVLEARRIDRSVDSTISQEIGEFRTLRAQDDPATGKPFTTAERLLEVFLERNLPDPDEQLFAFPADGRPSYQGEYDARLQRSTQFPALVERLSTTGGAETLTIDGHEYRVAVQPIAVGSSTSSFVVVHDVAASRAPLRDLIVTYVLLAALSVIVVAGVASWSAGRLLSPVRRLRETAQGITDGDLGGRIEVTGHDDLSDLQRTFNAMLDRLEAAFAAQRQLLDDAGHELRTPLTVLRGHLEVLDVDDPEDVAATRALLLDEIDRMSRLVDDLLMLAKARRPDFVRPRPVDVESLTLGALERARALADRRWVLDAVARTTAPVDGQRITQALLQLSENAARHTEVGDEIGIGSRTHEGRLELWVRDSGPGVDPAIAPAIFQRFAQGEDAREGFGLGLSIVSAIAEAHGGDVVLDDTDTGATFRVRLPMEGATCPGS
ncbi:sensor histidine kinase [Aeromicrobium chenweiae]|uniref:histidine kinase n=1 Tax=Aeromicrobium chenweiae TaxID=2079793 RepID=A0A2S0WN28_9ACTN|nr:ATP-binding protein [Aeromicrobium chenweiae]AWB92753.1 two-component sensor histidine kinase [Aeromicrobium chenweiae]TGN33745.1 HAMP domain-containing protein [Aeromicrobium chenweiae]